MSTCVTVTRDDGTPVKHDAARRVDRDPEGNLLVFGTDDELIAVYAPGRWTHALRVTGVTSEAQ